MGKGKENELEALKMLADWSKWLSATQAGLITAIGYMSIKEHIKPLPWSIEGVNGGIILLIMSTIAFTVSIIASAWLLYACPDVAVRLPSEDGKNIYTIDTYGGYGIIKVVHFSSVQIGGFIIGIILLAVYSSWSLLGVCA